MTLGRLRPIKLDEDTRARAHETIGRSAERIEVLGCGLRSRCIKTALGLCRGIVNTLAQTRVQHAAPTSCLIGTTVVVSSCQIALPGLVTPTHGEKMPGQ